MYCRMTVYLSLQEMSSYLIVIHFVFSVRPIDHWTMLLVIHPSFIRIRINRKSISFVCNPFCYFRLFPKTALSFYMSSSFNIGKKLCIYSYES